MGAQARQDQGSDLLRVVMRAISVGMSTFASLIVAAQAQAAGQLADLSLRPEQGRLQVELIWQGVVPPPVTTTQSDQELILEFERAQLSQSLTRRPLGSFPELGIQAVELVQGPEGVRLGITLMPGTPATDLNLQQFSPRDQSQRFEVWIAGLSEGAMADETTRQTSTTIPPVGSPRDASVTDEAERLEGLLSQVRQQALAEQGVIPQEPSPPSTSSPATQPSVSAPSVAPGQPALDDPAPATSPQLLASASDPLSLPASEPPTPVAPTTAAPASGSPSIEDLLTQVRRKAWERQGVLPPSDSSEVQPQVSTPAPSEAQPLADVEPQPAPPAPVAQSPTVPEASTSPDPLPSSTLTPSTREIVPDSTSSADLSSPPQQLASPSLPDLDNQGLTSTQVDSETGRSLILAPTLARQQNAPPPLIEPEPFLNRLDDTDIAAPLSRHSLIPFPGEDSVLLATQPGPGLPDTRINLLQDAATAPNQQPRLLTPDPRTPDRSQAIPLDQLNPRLPGQVSEPAGPADLSSSGQTSSSLSTLIPSSQRGPSFESTLPAATGSRSPAIPELPPLPGATSSTSSIAATEGGTTLPILTPSLERNQPLDLPSSPRFDTPALRDLPGATLTQPESTDPLLLPQPFLGQLGDGEVVSPLQRNSLALVPILAQANPPGSPDPFEVAILPDQEFERTLSPLERPPQRLFGFETGTILRHGEMMVHAGGTSFQNPNDFRTVLFDESNRSNDLQFGFDIGLWDTFQLSLGAEGKDDTIFANLIAENAGVSVIYQGIPVQLKWQAIDSPRLKAALVTSAQFPANTVPGRIDNQEFSNNPSSRKILITTDAAVENALLAEDSSIYYSIAAPVTYQLDRQTRITFNPQVSFFPETIPVTAVQGNAVDLQEADIGFDGERLNYLGTIVGLGLGLDYDLSRHIKFVADYTAIVSGNNSIEQTSDDSIFGSRSVWSAGFKFAPNSRLGIDLFATNRFGPLTYSPANILAQPGGDAGMGLGFTYLPDLGTTDYQIYQRPAYPEPSAFLSATTNFSPTVLPLGSAAYEIASGGSGRFSQMARFGLLDDLELVLSQSSFDRPDSQALAIEGSLLGRLAVYPDLGQTGLSAALGAGLLAYQNADEATTVALYGDFPMRFRSRNSQAVEWSLTPKLVIPTQASGDDNITAMTVGAKWSLSENTQVFGEYTPIFEGGNQLSDQQVSGAFLPEQSSLFSLGVRQMFSAQNSLYALDLYWSNTAGTTGLQGLAALPDGESQIGIRFTTLNGIPDLDPVAGTPQ